MTTITTGIQITGGIDLGSIFYPIRSGSSQVSATGFILSVGGSDISTIFEPSGSTTTEIATTGYKIIDGTDLCKLFAGMGSTFGPSLLAFSYSTAYLLNDDNATYNYAYFNNSGTLTVTNSGSVDILLVGGGGGGGYTRNVYYKSGAGGGGGGEVAYGTITLNTGSYVISIGSQGIGGSSGALYKTPAGSGGNTTFINGSSMSITVMGGGAGGSVQDTDAGLRPSGRGAGGCYSGSTTGTSGTSSGTTTHRNTTLGLTYLMNSGGSVSGTPGTTSAGAGGAGAGGAGGDSGSSVTNGIGYTWDGIITVGKGGSGGTGNTGNGAISNDNGVTSSLVFNGITNSINNGMAGGGSWGFDMVTNNVANANNRGGGNGVNGVVILKFSKV